MRPISLRSCPCRVPVVVSNAGMAPGDPSIGRSFGVSRFRRLVIDLMHFSAQVPTVVIERQMPLGPLVEARKAVEQSPTWSALFTRAFGLVSARQPPLRTSYLKFPWARFYEHPRSIATLNVAREVGGENVVLYALVASPEARSLREIDAALQDYQTGPVHALPSYRNANRLSWVPWPLRRIVWWLGLNLAGSLRCHHFGTFGLTSLGAQGAGMVKLVPILTATLHYGLFDDDGGLLVRLSFDHRVMDGVAAAEALVALEKTLLGEVLEECRGLS